MAEVPSSIPTGGNCFDDVVLPSPRKPLMSTLPTLCNHEKTRNTFPPEIFIP